MRPDLSDNIPDSYLDLHARSSFFNYIYEFKLL